MLFVFFLKEFENTKNNESSEQKEEFIIKSADLLKEWATNHIDSCVGALLDPYLNVSNSKINYEAFLCFYVLQNNKTQLKCLEQQKTFYSFSQLIKNIQDNKETAKSLTSQAIMQDKEKQKKDKKPSQQTGGNYESNDLIVDNIYLLDDNNNKYKLI